MEIILKEAADPTDGSYMVIQRNSFSGLAKLKRQKMILLSFIFPAYEKYFPTTKASAILVKPGFNKTRMISLY
jgi:hypothetical protein